MTAEKMPQRSADGTVGKALEILDQVAEFDRPVRFGELLAASEHPKATLYRLVQTLTNQGMLSFDVEKQTYAPRIAACPPCACGVAPKLSGACCTTLY